MGAIKRLGLVLAGAALIGVSACSTGTNAVDQTAGSQNRYVQVSGNTRYFEPGHRDAAPPISASLIGGGTYHLADERGHVVVLNLWGSWCPDCRVEASDLESVYQAHKADGVTFIGVDIRDDQDAAQAFMRGKRISYPSIDDPSGSVALQFRSVPPAATPSTLVIDAQGGIAAVHLGLITATELTSLIVKASA